MPKTTESSPNACGTASAAISIAPIAPSSATRAIPSSECRALVSQV